MTQPATKPNSTNDTHELTTEERRQEQIKRNQPAIALLKSLLEEDEGAEEERETWELLKRYLDEDRTSYRKLFDQ